MSQGFSWASAACTALSSFESPSGVHSQTQLPITLPQSSYDPLFSTTSLFDFALDQRLAPSNDHSGYAPGRTAIDHEQQQRNLWGGFTLNQGFSEHAQASSGFEDQDMSFQYLQMPLRNAMTIVPIYENATPYNANAPASNPNLYPHNAMPLTIKHPEFRQQQQQQQQQQAQQQAQQNKDAWAAHLMNNVERLEHSAQASANPQQPPLTISQSRPQSYAQPQPQSYQQQQQPQFTLEQIEQALLYQSVASAHHANGLAIEQLTANLHDKVAASRLNNGNKEIAYMPSAIPSVPSLQVRYPASSQRFAQNHPYTSPRFAPQPLSTGAGGTGTGAARGINGASARSVRPIVPRITTKRESLSVPAPMTTAYLAGLRRHVPLAELASERAPVEPYPRQGGGPVYPLALGNGAGSGAGSASTATSSLPPESPFSGNMGLPGSATAERSRERMGSMSPKKEQQQGGWPNGLPDGGSLRLNRGQERPGTGVSSHSGGSLVSPVMSRNGLLSPQMQMQAPQAPQVRANAARKRADDEILQHSFRAESDWQRRMVLEAVLSSAFVADNTLEPVSGPGEANANGGANATVTANGALSIGLDAGLGSPGKSVYAVFLEQVEKSEWRCLFGDREHPCPSQAVAFRRLERALDHVRSHLNHRPFGCKGECQKGDSCDARFFARSHLQDHVKRTESACCETCGQVIRIQNMPRHRMAH